MAEKRETREWVAILAAVLVAFAGIIFGIIKSSTGDDIALISKRQDAQGNTIKELVVQQAVFENEVGHIRATLDEVWFLLKDLAAR